MTKFLFRRSEIDPSLEDVELDVPLSEDQLRLVQEVRELEEDPKIEEAWMSGSCDLREYRTGYACPYGYSLVRPLEEVLEVLGASHEFLRSHMERIGRQNPECVAQMTQIMERYGRILGV